MFLVRNVVGRKFWAQAVSRPQHTYSQKKKKFLREAKRKHLRCDDILKFPITAIEPESRFDRRVG